MVKHDGVGPAMTTGILQDIMNKTLILDDVNHNEPLNSFALKRQCENSL